MWANQFSPRGRTRYEDQVGSTAGWGECQGRSRTPQAGQADGRRWRRRYHLTLDVPILPSRAPSHQNRHDNAGDRPNRRVRRTVEMGCRRRQQVSRRRHRGRRREASGSDPQSRQPVEPEPRVGSGRAAHQQRPRRHHGCLVDRRHHQSGGRPVRTQWRALYYLGRSLAVMVLRPQGRPEEGLPVDLSFLLGLRSGRQHVRRDVAKHSDQQKGRRDAHQRSRRHRSQRSGAWIASDHQEPRLRRELSRSLSTAVGRFHRADQQAEEHECRHCVRHFQPAAICDFLDAVRAAGLPAEDHDAAEGAIVSRPRSRRWATAAPARPPKYGGRTITRSNRA